MKQETNETRHNKQNKQKINQTRNNETINNKQTKTINKWKKKQLKQETS